MAERIVASLAAMVFGLCMMCLLVGAIFDHLQKSTMPDAIDFVVMSLALCASLGFFVLEWHIAMGKATIKVLTNNHSHALSENGR
jgi:hypothetical protein